MHHVPQAVDQDRLPMISSMLLIQHSETVPLSTLLWRYLQSALRVYVSCVIP